MFDTQIFTIACQRIAYILLLTVKSFVKAFRTTLAKYFTLRFVKVFCKVHCKVVGKVLYNFRDI